jgi:cytoskeletal protein RodZ
MSELGQVLREAREAKGVSLAEAEDATKIRLKYLRALEEGQYDILPPSVYVRGFLRSYANYLGLDPEYVVELYDQTVPEGITPREPQIIAEPLVPSSRINWELIAGILLLIAVGVLAVWVYRQYVAPLALSPTPTPPTVAERKEAAQSIPAANPSPVRAAASPTAVPPTATPVPPTATPVPPTATRPPRPTATPTTAPAQATDLRLALRTTARSWLRIIIDGETVFQGILNAGESRIWRGKREIRLRTGNAGGVEVTLNGQPLGALGKSGEVLERIWTLSANGTIRVSTPVP